MKKISTFLAPPLGASCQFVVTPRASWTVRSQFCSSQRMKIPLFGLALTFPEYVKSSAMQGTASQVATAAFNAPSAWVIGTSSLPLAASAQVTSPLFQMMGSPKLSVMIV